MEQKYQDTNCPLHGSEYCEMLNMQSCAACTVRCRNEQETQTVREDLDTIMRLMPKGGVSELYTGDECVLCKGEKKGKAEVYALTDLGNAEPKRNNPSLLGLKLKSKAGSVVPIQLSCCKECRKRFLLIEYLPGIIGTAGAALILILMSIRPIREPIAQAMSMLPFLLFAVITAGSIIAGFLLRTSMTKKFAAHTHLDIMEIDKLREMKELGWFELYEKKGCSKLVFAKERLKQGVLTGDAVENAEDGKKSE